MRTTSLLTTVAFVLLTTSLAGVRTCQRGGHLEQVWAQAAHCCCAPASCDCQQPCYGASERPEGTSIAALAPTDAALAALTGSSAHICESLHLSSTARLLPQESTLFTSHHASCLGTRAPPLA